MLDSCQNSRTDLQNIANSYLESGWSVIPIRGAADPANAKVAAVAWAAYQRRRPTRDELDAWFEQAQFKGLAVVCGRVSQLAVLDFDDPERARAFAAACPDLVDTYTVESGNRGLPHYYYHVPADVQIKGQRVPGVDLQFEGTYVVAPPTAIDGSRWVCTNDTGLHTLTQGDVERIYGFFRNTCYGIDAILPVDVLCVDLDSAQSDKVTALALVSWYRRLALRVGRNNALFRAACLARDGGWLQHEVRALLLGVHVMQVAHDAHSTETPEQRHREALTTIQSAYRYNRRRHVSQARRLQGLPNSIREALLQNRQAGVARVLEGLRLAGIAAGRWLSERVICQLLSAFSIGRRTVMTALKSCTDQGLAIFESPPNPPVAGAAKDCDDKQKKCIFVSRANRVKKGRPARLYRVPDNQSLYRLLGVRPSGSDPLTAGDLVSPDAYRQALHRELIERRPGLYSRRWLSARLGISSWTSRRYDRRLGLSVSYTFHSKRIMWANVEDLPRKKPTPDGTFIETPDGKRYPPVLALAKRLLQRCSYLVYKRQHWNYYTSAEVAEAAHVPVMVDESYGEEIHKRAESPRPVSVVAMGTIQPTEQEARKLELMFYFCEECRRLDRYDRHPDACSRCGGHSLAQVPEHIWRDPQRCREWWQGVQQTEPARDAVDPQHLLAGRLYAAVQERTPERALTRERAYRLVCEYGDTKVERALLLLAERTDIYNAAGFIVSVLRGTDHPAGERNSHESWLSQLKQSRYIGFYANADQILQSG